MKATKKKKMNNDLMIKNRKYPQHCTYAGGAGSLLRFVGFAHFTTQATYQPAAKPCSLAIIKRDI